MKYLTDFLDQFKDRVGSLPHPERTLLFFRRLNSPDIESNDDVDDAFECFKMTIQSMRHTPLENGVQLELSRQFDEKEIFSGKLKHAKTMHCFIWSLGYEILGAGTWNTNWEKDRAKCVEFLYILSDILEKTSPPVRSLQSICYVFAKKLDIDVAVYEDENPTINEMERVDMIKKLHLTILDNDLEKHLKETREYSIRRRYYMESYHFSSCLALLEDLVDVEPRVNLRVNLDGNEVVIARSLLLKTVDFQQSDVSVRRTLYNCVLLMCDSPLVNFFLHITGSAEDPSGILLQRPSDNSQVVNLVMDINLTLLKLKGRTLTKCHVLPFFGCKHCIVKEAHHQACIIFMMKLFNKFLFTA